MSKSHYSKYRKKSNILVTCEHASKRIPKEYGLLGLTREDLKNSKDWNDEGSYDVMKNLSEKIGSSYLYSNVSRLFIDCNRKLNPSNKDKDSFYSCPMKTELLVEKDEEEKLIKIPANIYKNKKEFSCEEKKRYKEYVEPYVKDGYKIIEKIRGNHEKSFLIMIHSFFPVYNGDKRKTDIGVLHENSSVAKKITKSLRKNSNGLKIDENKPYKLADADGAVFYKVQEEMDDVELIVFELNNKNLRTKTGVNKISSLIYKSLKDIGIV